MYLVSPMKSRLESICDASRLRAFMIQSTFILLKGVGEETERRFTFFGSRFDLPYLRATFPGVVLDHPHLDLCFAARRLGLDGGLKHIEGRMGIRRPPDLQGLDGWDAVRLWHAWSNGETAARDRWLRYNEADTRNLEPLAELLYSRLAARYGPKG